MKNKGSISIVAALSAERRAVGNKDTLLWHLPDDLKRFKEITLGHPIILGRKTFDSIVNMLGKPLPGRVNIVVTRNTEWSYPGVMVVHSLDEAVEKARALDSEEIFIGGGPEIWRLAMPLVDTLYLTLVDDEPGADAFFPEFENEFTEVSKEKPREENGISYTWVTYKRIT